MGGERAKEFFLSIRESWGECEKTSTKLGLLGGGGAGRGGGGIKLL